MSKIVKALMLGDVIGQPGCRALFIALSRIVKENSIDFVVVNGENADNGFGITPEIAERFFDLGVHVITTGNHIWQKDEILPYLNRNSRILRPANYPKKVAGTGFVIVENRGVKYGVLNLIGRINLVNVDCPFVVAKKIINDNKKNCDFILVDFHAESVEEKEALAYFLDGQCAVLVGTHTHVQTADERILPKGTAYLSDLGMTGPVDSVIGSEPQLSIERVLTQLPIKMMVADNDSVVNGVVCTLDCSTGLATKIERFHEMI